MMTRESSHPDRWLATLARESLSGLPTLADQIVEQMWDDVYDPAGPVAKDDLWQSCHDNLSSMLTVLVEQEPAPAELLWTARATGSRRAHQHCPLEWVLQAWRAGGQVMWSDLAERTGARDPAELQHLVDRASDVWGVTERFSIEMAVTYQRAEQQLLDGTDQHLAEVIDALLDGRAADVRTEAVRLLNLSRTERFLVVTAEDVPAYHGWPSPLARALNKHGIHSRWRLRAGVHIGLLTADHATPDEAVQALSTCAVNRVGISPVLTGLHQVPAGYRMATLAMSTLPAHQPGITTLDHCLPDALLLSSPELAQRLVTTTFGPVLALPEHERDELLRTVQVWVQSLGSTLRAAKTLYCHRNTVLNRLHRIHTLTKLDLNDVGVWPQLMLALSALQHHADAPNQPNI